MIRRSADFLELMGRRRTVRDYRDRPVPREVIENALRTASLAPSGANQQPWTFVCISDASIKSRIRMAAEDEGAQLLRRTRGRAMAGRARAISVPTGASRCWKPRRG